jgi:cytochrome P450
MTALDPVPRPAPQPVPQPMPLCPVAHGRPYDPLSPEAAVDPEPWLSLARAEQPVFYLPGQDVWCVTRYADIREVLRNPGTYSSRYANKFRPMTSAGLREVYPNGHPGLHSMLLKDPPEHSRVRRLANTAFTPKMAAAMEPRIRARCDELIDAFIADGHCELVAQYSSKLTVGTMMDISGAPQTLGEEFARWGQDYFARRPARSSWAG